MSIIIFTGPVQSGKTTALIKFGNSKLKCQGIYMPDIGGRRKIQYIDSNEIFDAQCNDLEHTTKPLTSVGRFHFYSDILEQANDYLNKLIIEKPFWLIIDEAGKLELKELGFYNAIKNAINVYDLPESNYNLILVIRDSLCDDIIKKFSIKNYRIIKQLEKL